MALIRAAKATCGKPYRVTNCSLLLTNPPPSLVGMETCSGAHLRARKIRKIGHDVRIVAPKFVITYRKDGKNDNNDAATICEVVARPDMHFVPD